MKKKLFIAALVCAVILFAATKGNLEWSQFRSDNVRGSTAGAIGQSACGSVTTGHVGAFDSTGCLVDGGAGGGSGTVTSVAAAVPTGFTISGSPVTTSGTLTIGYATGLTTHQVLGTGSSGALALVSLTGADLPNPSASTLGGVQSIAAVTSKWINTISTSGVPSLTQPAFTDISGSVAASQLPTPTTSTFGGIKDIAAVTHQWIDSIVSGVPHLSQPAQADLSWSGTSSQCVRGDGSNGSCTVVSGGGNFLGLWGFTSPPTTGWTWDNQGSGSLTSNASYQYAKFPSQGGVTHMSCLYRTAPAGTYTITVAMLMDISGIVQKSGNSSNAGAGVGFRDGTGKIVWFYFSTGSNAVVQEWTSTTSFSGTTLASFGPATEELGFFGHTPALIQISDDGTNMIWRLSVDGLNWETFYSVVRTTFFGAGGPTQVLYGAYCNSTAVTISVVSWG